jgi:hypothetical protein
LWDEGGLDLFIWLTVRIFRAILVGKRMNTFRAQLNKGMFALLIVRKLFKKPGSFVGR